MIRMTFDLWINGSVAGQARFSVCRSVRERALLNQSCAAKRRENEGSHVLYPDFTRNGCQGSIVADKLEAGHGIQVAVCSLGPFHERNRDPHNHLERMSAGFRIVPDQSNSNVLFPAAKGARNRLTLGRLRSILGIDLTSPVKVFLITAQAPAMQRGDPVGLETIAMSNLSTRIITWRRFFSRTGTLWMGLALTLPLGAQFFSDSSIRGPYVMTFDGVVSLPQGPVPIAVVGRMVFDGAGNWTGRRVLVVPGTNGNQVIRETNQGRVTIRPDGTAHFSLTESSVEDTDARITEDAGECYITQGGEVFRCIVTNLTIVAGAESNPIPVMNSGSAHRQWVMSYYDQNLRGNYAYRFIGTTFVPTPRPFRQMGTIYADGAGKATLRTDRITNLTGVVLREAGSTTPRATYTVRREGWTTITTEITDQQGSVVSREKQECVLAQRGETAYCVVTEAVRFDLGPDPVSIPTVARGTWSLIQR